jgi:hypothetical protein
MMRALRVSMLAIVFTLAAMIGQATRAEDLKEYTLTIKARIDHQSELIIRNGRMYWLNIGGDLPGRYGKEREPTYINGAKWWPRWSGKTKAGAQSKKHRLPSSTIPRGKLAAQLVRFTGRGKVTVAAKGGAVTIRFEDGAGGPAWYEAVVTIIPASAAKAGPAKEPHKARGAQLSKREFLRTTKDLTYRADMWFLYCEAEAEARKFAQWRNWHRIIKADCNRAGRAIWVCDGKRQAARIDIPENANDKGVIFHETFHSAFHKCPLWRNAKNQAWGDAFCDVFRYFMESKHNKDSAWLRDAEARLAKGGKFNKKPDWPLAIVRHCNKDYETFLKFWRERNEKGWESLDAFFRRVNRNK